MAWPGLLVAAPALLALLLAVAMPQARAGWLALLLAAAAMATMFLPLLPWREQRQDRGIVMGRVETALLLVVVICAALLLPLPAGMLLLALARAGLVAWRGVVVPGFPVMDAALLLGAALAMAPA